MFSYIHILGGVCHSWIFGLIAAFSVLAAVTVAVILTVVIKRNKLRKRKSDQFDGVNVIRQPVFMEASISGRPKHHFDPYLPAVEEKNYYS